MVLVPLPILLVEFYEVVVCECAGGEAVYHNNIHSREYMLVVQGSMMGTLLPVVSTLKLPETYKIILRRK